MGKFSIKKLSSTLKLLLEAQGEVASLRANEDLNIPAYQGGASWRQSRRWGGFVNQLKVSLWLKGGTGGIATGVESLVIAMLVAIALPNIAHAAAPTLTMGWGTDGNAANGNITITTTKGTAGVYTGSHTLHISSTSTYGYNITLSNTTNSNSLTNSTNTNATPIASITGSTDSKGVSLTDNTWGYTLTNPVNDTNKATAIWHTIPVGGTKPTKATIANLTKGDNGATGNKDYVVTYGAKLAADAKEGSYKTADNALQYTITANLPATPTITSVTPATIKKSNTTGATETLTVTGTNLDTAYDVYLQLPSDTTGKNKITCSTVTPNADGTSLACKLPTNGSNIAENQAYTLYVQTQAANLGSKAGAVTYQPGAIICRAGDSKSECAMSIDANMIPVKYTGNETTAQWTSLTNSEISNNAGSWYDYGNKQWANAVTVKDPSKYKDKSLAIAESDVLGYWVYIPRYEYQVRSSSGNTVPSEKNFTIRFQTTSQKSTPTCTNNSADETKPSTWKDCAWGTSPAFTWGSTELAGFWMGKFETTGSTASPTVLPSSEHIAGDSTDSGGSAGSVGVGMGTFYNISKSIGVQDSANTYGGSKSVTYNKHKLAKLTSHMLKNSEWGAAAYLSASKYGAGVNNVKINANNSLGTDGNGLSSYGTTGCGPASSSSESSTSTCNAYTTALGQTASTTGNTTGVYDMSGGAWEYVMGNYGSSTAVNSDTYTFYDRIAKLPKAPYVDLYNRITSHGNCTWNTCGGDALYETAGWGDDVAGFVYGRDPWFVRGGGNTDGSNAGVFYFYNDDDGYTDTGNGFRVALRAS